VEANQLVEGQLAQDIAGLTRMLAMQLDPRDPTSLLAIVKAQLNAADPRSLLGKLHFSLEDINAITTAIRNETDPKQQQMFLAKLHSILDHVNDATRLLKSEIDAGQEGGTAARVHLTLEALNQGVNTVVDMLEDNRQPITDTITRVHHTSEILEQQIAARIARQLDPADAAGLLAKVHVALDRLGTSLRDMNSMTGSARNFIAINKDQINGIVGNFKETSDHLKAASKEIRRSPWRLFYQPTMEESAKANVHDAARAFSDAATKLDDAVMRLQSMSQSRDPTADQAELKKLSEQLDNSFQNFTKVESALWEQLKIK
jgi:hypothetical protein